jgi:RimJ/RimL family protein N-acetyltransferase
VYSTFPQALLKAELYCACLEGLVMADERSGRNEMPQELVGERVMLRPYRPGDGAAFWQAIEESREHLRPWMPWSERITTPADAEAHVQRGLLSWTRRDDLIVGLWERTTGTFLGESGLGPDWEAREFELGFWLRSSAEGHGYMTKANRLLCEWAFAAFSAQRVFMCCDLRNLRSIAVAHRLGFREAKPEAMEAQMRIFERTSCERMNPSPSYAKR